MAFARKTWKNREAEFPGRRLLTPVKGAANTYDVTRQEGLVLEDGDPFDQATMNDLEGRIYEGIQEAGIYTAVLLAAGWTGDAANGFTQTASCAGMSAAYDTEGPSVPTTGVKATDAALQEGLATLCEAGNHGETLDGQVKFTCYGECPTVDLPIRLRRVAEGRSGA